MTDNDNNTVVFGGAAKPGAPRSPENVHNALPVGTRMGEFEIIGLVGEGGFGIVYLAQDHSLERKVALKEYMPASLAARGEDASVVVRSERHQETFEIGRRSFVNEARLLAKFDHPALLKVYRFWEANGTAYMAMPYYDGQTLRDLLRNRPTPPDEAWLKKMLDPVTDALATIHADNCFHRDIAPDNIMLLRDGRPIVLDFGAARHVISDMTQALTVILKPGYAPIEQYAEMPGMKQGAWTDVYALAAVVYFSIARKLPPPSVSRIVQDSYEPLATLAAGRYSDAFLSGIDRCLAVKPENRPQSMAEMRKLIGIGLPAAPSLVPQPPIAQAPAEPAPPLPPAADARPAPLAKESAPARPPARAVTVDADEQRAPAAKGSKAPLLLGLGVAALAAAAGGAWYFLHPTPAPQPSAQQPAAISAPAAVPAPVQSAPVAPPPASAPASEPATAASQATASTAPNPAAARSEPARVEAEPAAKPTAAPEPATVAPPKKSARSAEARPGKAAEAKPAKPARPADAKPAGDTGDKAERDYMKKLNRDLDNLLK